MRHRCLPSRPLILLGLGPPLPSSGFGRPRLRPRRWRLPRPLTRPPPSPPRRLVLPTPRRRIAFPRCVVGSRSRRGPGLILPLSVHLPLLGRRDARLRPFVDSLRRLLGLRPPLSGVPPLPLPLRTRVCRLPRTGSPPLSALLRWWRHLPPFLLLPRRLPPHAMADGPGGPGDRRPATILGKRP